MDHPNHDPTPSFWKSPAGLAWLVAMAVGGYYLLTEHRAHLYGFLPYLALADRALCIGRAPAAESYLNIPALLAALDGPSHAFASTTDASAPSSRATCSHTCRSPPTSGACSTSCWAVCAVLTRVMD